MIFFLLPGALAEGLLPKWLLFPPKVAYPNLCFSAAVHAEDELPSHQQKLPIPHSIPLGPYEQLGNCSYKATILKYSELIMTSFVIQHRLCFHANRGQYCQSRVVRIMRILVTEANPPGKMFGHIMINVGLENYTFRTVGLCTWEQEL